MRSKWIGTLCVACGLLMTAQSFLHGDEREEAPLPPEVIEKQLTDAEKEFDEAKKMFNPWYAGPLLTPSAHIIGPQLYNIQPYAFFTNDYAVYDSHGHSHDIPHRHQISVPLYLQYGIVNRLEALLLVKGIHNRQGGHSATNWGDTAFALGFAILKEAPYQPAIAVYLKETFPTGRYQKLNRKKDGVDGMGAGSYQTTLSLDFSKVIWWWTKHPMATRLSLNYTLAAPVHVRGFNTYGGVRKTHGTIGVVNTFEGDFGYEFSFTQRWVVALDVVYTYSSKSKFSGHRGRDAAGAHALVGGPFNDQLSLAPALEYNPNANLGFLAGVWFPVWGRNSTKFFSEIISLTYTW
jgi:hypothetical protein